MWYCRNCDTELDDFQINYDSNNDISCGFCHGEVEPSGFPQNSMPVKPSTSVDSVAVREEAVKTSNFERSDSDIVNGLAMVNEYAELMNAKKEIELKIERLKSRIINYAETNDKRKIDGSSKTLLVTRIDQVIFPDDKTALINHMKQIGVYDEYSIINYSRLRSAIQRNEIESGIREFVNLKKDYRLSLRKI